MTKAQSSPPPKIASAARPAVVSFPGSKGYKAWELCTLDEAGHCIETFESQGSDMIKSAVLYRQAYHKRFRGAPGGQAREGGGNAAGGGETGALAIGRPGGRKAP